MSKVKNLKHLDLGCGITPRNPFSYKSIFGVDIIDESFFQNKNKNKNIKYKKVNLTTKPIPFPDNTFDSVSAFDFIEHIPRALILKNDQTVFPFVQLMDEIYRVLKKNGIFIAQTPCYPAEEIFTDPTHVNFITRKTFDYFSGNFPQARIYGFKGKFEIIEKKIVPGRYLTKKFKNKIEKFIYLLKKQVKNENTHLLVRIKAIK